MTLNKTELMPYVSYGLDDALSPRDPNDAPPNARLVCWQCGFEPMCVAVWSCLPDVSLDDDEAADLATDYLAEIKWFSDGPQQPDFII